MGRKFRLIADNPRFPDDMPEGTVVYECMSYDYGLARDDTFAFGEEHISVTLEPNTLPSFTCPTSVLAQI